MKHPKSYDTTPETRARMAHVALKGGRAETLLAHALWRRGLRYRKNDRRLPGSPDIAVLRYRIAVFIDGEFWHGKDRDERVARLRRNREYWTQKIDENITRDRKNDLLLRQAGWLPVHFWEKDVLRDPDGRAAAIEELAVQRSIGGADEAVPAEDSEQG